MHLIFPKTRFIGLDICLLFSLKFVQWTSKDASFLQQSALWPFKVIQGRWFWYRYQSKARMQLPVSPSLWLWSYLAPFLRYGDLLAEIAYFCYPLSFGAASLCSLWNFALKLTMRKLESWAHGAILQWRRRIAWVVLTWYRPVSDGQTDRQTDGIYHS